MITTVVGQAIKNTIEDIAASYGWEIITHGMETDHYHILIWIQPCWAPATVVEKLKSNSGRIVFRKFPDVKNRLWGGEFWADGYFINTVGRQGSETTIKWYISSQGKNRGYIVLHKDQLKLF